MKRSLSLSCVILSALVSHLSRAQAASAPPAPAASATATNAAHVPAGWKERIDRSTSADDPDAAGEVRILSQGSGYHILTPSAAVFWHPTNLATGDYTLKGTFTLNVRSDHVNHYGLIFGGTNLDTAVQNYTYFMVAQDNPPGGRGQAQPLGVWLAKVRTGETTTSAFAGITGAGRNGAVPHSAIKVPDATGKSVNNLEVRVQADKVDFVVNGTIVHSSPRAGVHTDGIWGIRSNHLLDITVDHLEVTK